ncbi:STY4528 family pathogenicity island replication protein [Chromohalobacter japonicus]|uniref:STY4528 family pathogenicity island replication protein n=1 Tax=Chromohalobacter japonicus TaxID=223900 RepID=UPI001FF687EB|nr:STY4528 family pathogenicity island replication protein [Chromohalobacter japonicus]MCK0753591.1 STY4528 family pathogenicity island replication protein [Chromohalobacter japonicus]
MRRVDTLQALIGRATSQVTRRGEAPAPSDSADDTESLDGLLFLGNPHETVPRALLLDERLGAMDILGWQMIRLLASDDKTTAFPTYDQLQPLLRAGVGKVASRSTVARVIAILRLTRWLSLAHRARHETNGRVLGNVYVLHDEPVSPTEATLIDDDYLAFVAQSCKHRTPAIREVAQRIREELAEDGILLTAAHTQRVQDKTPAPLERFQKRAARFEEVQPEYSASTAQYSQSTKPENKHLHLSTQGVLSGDQSSTAPSTQQVLSPESSTYPSVLNEYSAPTGTSTVGSNTHTNPGLVWHGCLDLGTKDRQRVTDWLAPLPNDTQQLVLDEVAGRVDAGYCRSPVGLLRSLATRACQGEFNATQFAQHYATTRPSSGASGPSQPSQPSPTRSTPPTPPQWPEKPVLTEKGKAAREEVRALVGRVRRP